MSARLPLASLAGATAFALLIVPGAALAQDGPADRAGKAVSHAEITAGTADSSASITLVVTGDASGGPLKEGVQGWRRDQLSITVSTPFDGEKEAKPATLDGLADGTKFSIRYGSFSGASRYGLAADSRRIANEAREVCLSKKRAEFSAANGPLGDDATAAARAERDKKLEDALKPCWRPANGSSGLVFDYLPGQYEEYERKQAPGGMLDWGVEGAVGYRKFDYVDVGTVTPKDSTKVQFSGKVFVAFYPTPLATAWTGSIGYERGYTAKDKATICPVPTGTTPVTCTVASPAAPELDESLLFSVGFRHRFMGGKGKPLALAIAPLVTYDALDNVFGVDVPVYFFSDGKSGLIGGARGGWRSDERKFTFSVFIGSSFDIFK